MKNLKKKTKIGLVHGVFDIIHIGHIKYFKEAKNLVDYLIVSVTTDKFIKKGPGKPIFGIDKRCEVLKSIKYIDEVIISNFETAKEVIKKVKPDIYIKGKDYKNFNDDLSKNILIEKKEVEKYGGKLAFTQSELHSSSSIINKNFNYISDSAKKILKIKNLKKIFEVFRKSLSNFSDKKILIIGDPILDIVKFVKASGKSNKNNILATRLINSETTYGGTILVANFLSQFYKNLDYLYVGNSKDYNFLKKKLNKNINLIKIISKNSLIKKNRYVDEYTFNRLFQNNENEESKLDLKIQNDIKRKLQKTIKKYHQILLFDYGYIFSSKDLINFFNNYTKNLVVNCQSNSFNFGFNIPDKYKKAKILSIDEAEFRLLVKDGTTEVKKLITTNLNKFKNYKYAIITQGKTGCYVIHSRKIKFIPTILNQRLDTTGAGDIFLSMFSYLILNTHLDLEEITIVSHVVAGIHSNELANRYNLDKINLQKVLGIVFK
tara:strand:- start:34 stop:1503 length:1470 start_codon:yes stop_codon:yes gene_type:complete